MITIVIKIIAKNRAENQSKEASPFGEGVASSEKKNPPQDNKRCNRNPHNTTKYDTRLQKSSVRWAHQQIVCSEDRLQATGRDNDTIRLKGTFYPQVAAMVGGTVGTQSLDDLRSMMKAQKPQILVSPGG